MGSISNDGLPSIVTTIDETDTHVRSPPGVTSLLQRQLYTPLREQPSDCLAFRRPLAPLRFDRLRPRHTKLGSRPVAVPNSRRNSVSFPQFGGFLVSVRATSGFQFRPR
jgi:hypothetical protein